MFISNVVFAYVIKYRGSVRTEKNSSIGLLLEMFISNVIYRDIAKCRIWIRIEKSI